MGFLVDESARLYGSVVVGDSSIVEGNVVIGHPSPREVSGNLGYIGSFDSTTSFYRNCRGKPTVIGSGAIVRSGTVIYSGVYVGDDFDCGHNVVIREDTMIGDNVYVKNNTEIVAGVQIGSACRIAGVVADYAIIGDRVSSFGALTHSYNTYIPPRRTGAGRGSQEGKAPTVKNGAIVGRGAVVIGQRIIGEDAVIGANAVVRSDVPQGARVIVEAGSLRVEE